MEMHGNACSAAPPWAVTGSTAVVASGDAPAPSGAGLRRSRRPASSRARRPETCARASKREREGLGAGSMSCECSFRASQSQVGWLFGATASTGHLTDRKISLPRPFGASKAASASDFTCLADLKGTKAAPALRDGRTPGCASSSVP